MLNGLECGVEELRSAGQIRFDFLLGLLRRSDNEADDFAHQHGKRSRVGERDTNHGRRNVRQKGRMIVTFRWVGDVSDDFYHNRGDDTGEKKPEKDAPYGASQRAE